MAYPRIFAYNRQHEVDDGHLDKMSGDPKTPEEIMFDSCDIKPLSLLNIYQKTKVVKNNPIVLFDSGKSYNFIKT